MTSPQALRATPWQVLRKVDEVVERYEGQKGAVQDHTKMQMIRSTMQMGYMIL